MGDQENIKDQRRYSRRTFLGKASLGLAGLVALGVTSGRAILSPFVGRRQPPSFPKDSIFAPRENPPTRA